MKNLNFTILLTLVAIISQVQLIEGIGVIKLGETEKRILTDLKIDEKKIIDRAAQKKKNISKVLKNSVVRFKYDPTSNLVKDLSSDFNIDNYFEKCSDAVIYQIPEYQIAGTALKNFKLFFYKDTLVKIFTDDRLENEEFIRVFKAKFGEGKVISSSKPSKDFPDKMDVYTANLWAVDTSKNTEVNLENYRVSIWNATGFFKEINQYGMETGDATMSKVFSFDIQNPVALGEMTKCSQNGTNSKN